MFGVLLLTHILAATIWTGGHIILATLILPKALKQKSPAILLEFEAGFERVGMPSLLIQIATGLAMAHRVQPDVTQWFNLSNPLAHPILAKIILLTFTVMFALHARFRVIPHLSPSTLPVMAWHIVPVTVISVLFVAVGVSFRTGWLY
ncbi:CopD family protein [Halioxenophilus aromaticivorans]|uniref:CopD family protein n=1 Tax=Halioxenophilus aromaticivorans TaxID=1306992 RepID=A0AAV3U1W0_9ALTE